MSSETPEVDDVEVEGSTENPYANVVTFGRKSHGEVVPWSPPPETHRDRITAKKRDEDAADLLQMVLERIDAGELHGFALVAGKFDDKGNLIDVATVISETAASYPLAFMGAVEDMKLTLADFRATSDGEGLGHTDPEIDLLFDGDIYD